MRHENIKLIIALPHKVLPEVLVSRVILPAVDGNLTVLPERAPTTLLLTDGVLDMWDEDDVSIGKYFIKGGMADIAADTCTVTTEKAIDIKDINTARAQVLKYEHQKKLDELGSLLPACESGDTDSDIDFYQYIFNYLGEHPEEEDEEEEETE